MTISLQRNRVMMVRTCAAVMAAVPPPSRRREERSNRSKSGIASSDAYTVGTA